MRLRWIVIVLALLFASGEPQSVLADPPAPTPDENPESNTGALKTQVETGGGYDAHSGNGTRVVNDLHVPDALGMYGLDFTRYWNSLHNNDTNFDAEWPMDFGASGWSHSWRWTAIYAEEPPDFEPGQGLGIWTTSITINYPDGHSTKFKLARDNSFGAGRCGPPYNPSEIDWAPPGPAAHDQLVDMDPTGSEFWLNRADGGSVHFRGVESRGEGGHLWWYYEADKVYDPHGFLTELSYDEGGYLQQVTQDGGRWLKLDWRTLPDWDGVPVIASVESGGEAGSQLVTYHYTRFTDLAQGFYYLSSVRYPNEPMPGQTTSAYYVYRSAFVGDSPTSGPQSEFPLLKYADDPHYAGAMTQIRYDYRGISCPVPQFPDPDPPESFYNKHYFVREAIAAERSGKTGLPVARFGSPCDSGLRADYNGIGGWRQIYFGTSAEDPQLECFGRQCRGYMLVKVTDFVRNGFPIDASVPSRKQRGAEPTRVFDGLGHLTKLAYHDGSGKASDITWIDDSTCIYDRVNGNLTEPPSMTPNLDLIRNDQHQWLFRKKDEGDKWTKYARDERRRVTDIKYEGDNNSEHFEYNDLNQITSHKLVSGAVVTYVYHPGKHWLMSEYNSFDGQGASKDYSYDSLGRVQTVTDCRARASSVPVSATMTYNGAHKITSIQYPGTGGASSSPIVRYEYDRYGNCTAIIDELLHRREYTYDSYRRCTSYTEPVNDGCGATTRTWNWIYDRVIVDADLQVVQSFGASTHTSKDWRVQVGPAFNSGDGRRVTARTFDVNNRIRSEQTGCVQPPGPIGPGNPWTCSAADSETHSFTYDENGQKKTYKDPKLRETVYGYDVRNRLWTTTEFEAPATAASTTPRITTTLYDTTGNKLSVEFPDHEKQKWGEYDAFGQAWQFTDERNNISNLTYQWGPMKKLQRVETYPDGIGVGLEVQLTSFAYDPMGRPTEVHFPDGSYEKSTHECGQVKTWKTRREQLKTIEIYDARGREVRHSWSGGAAPLVVRQWDDANQLKSIVNKFAAIEYQYDDAGQLVKERTFVAGTNVWKELNYCHYPSGEVSTVTYPDQTVVVRDYTARGQLKGVEWGTGSTSYAYLADGKVDYQSYNNQMRTDYRYNGRGFVSSVQHKNYASGLNLAYREYWRDHRDRIEAWKRGTLQSQNGMEDGRGDRYVYDPEGQLTRADYRAENPQNANPGTPRRGDRFFYDALGNRVGLNRIANRGNMWIQRRSDNGLNQYNSWQNDYPASNPIPWGSGMFYDDNIPEPVPSPTPPHAPWPWFDPGNGVLMQDGNITASFNALNQPVAMWGKAGFGSNFLWFGYDPVGRCVKRWMGREDDNAPASNPATYYYYDGWNLVQEGPNASTAERLYVHGGRVDEIVASRSGAQQWYYHHYDARGHCILLTDTSCGIVEQYDYDAFGYPYFYDGAGNRQGSQLYGNRFLFTGREWLSGLRIYDFRNRMYQPELGHFLQPDPKQFEAGDYNLYRYCHNDPVNKSDPFGLEPIYVDPAVFDLGVQNARISLQLSAAAPERDSRGMAFERRIDTFRNNASGALRSSDPVVGRETANGQRTEAAPHDRATETRAAISHSHPKGGQPGHNTTDKRAANDSRNGGNNPVPSFIANGKDGSVEVYIPSNNPEERKHLLNGTTIQIPVPGVRDRK